jgi:predicted transcriptional regulator
MEDNRHEMTIESLNKKIENQAKVVKGLTNENEELYHQYNHLIIRNGKMLKRIDDYQKIIDDLHIRIEELQLINGNMMQLNDKLRKRKDLSVSFDESNDLNSKSGHEAAIEKIEAEFNLDELYNSWKKYPGQVAQNGPNLRKQVLMLIHLYRTTSLCAADLFNRSGVGGVTGARYVGTLKKFGLIRFSGARKKGFYEITKMGVEFVEMSPSINDKYLKTNQKQNPSSFVFSDDKVMNSVEIDGLEI